MKFASIAFGVLAALAGIIAAIRWHQASNVLIMPMVVGPSGDLGPVSVHDSEWVVATLKTFQKSGDLNARAARWTAASVVLGGFSTVLGALSATN